MGTISKVKLKGTEHLIASTAYATCTTAAATAAKVATVQNNHAFSLIEGETIHVYFKYSNTASSPTLNINNTGAKPIRQHGSTAPIGWGSAWKDQSIISFTYNTDLISTGCWLMNDFSYQSALTVDFDYQYAYSEGFDTDAGTVGDAIIDVYNQTKNINPDWSASAGASSILNKPAIPSTAADINAAPSNHTHNADEISFVPRSQQWQDPLYDQTLGETIGSSLENSLNFTYHSIIQVYNDTSQTIEVESGIMTFVPFNAIHYKNDVNGVFSLDSTGGVKVNQAGYYRVSGSLCGYTDSNAITTSGTVNNYRRGLYIFVGTSPNTDNCMEWVSHVEYSVNGVAFGVTPQIIYANQNDIIYLVFRPMGQAGKFNPGLLRQSFLNVERLPGPYPAS